MRVRLVSFLLFATLAALPVPADPPGEVWWSLRPLRRPDVPPSAEGSRNAVDAFVRAKLRAAGLSPAPEADRRTLIRRLTFDLIGLPPTPAEVAAFIADPAPDAYERLVERLLGSPHYGERWARHWMDAVHFAETHGHDQDRIRPNAWRYRDYLIASFNADTAYGRFVREQVATDVLYPDEPAKTPALGFLAAGPWDESSLRDIREDSIDRVAGHYLDRDDVVTTVVATFLSLTAHCARCHDHKFDPISQAEYYGFQAVFAGIGRADRAYDADPQTQRRRRELKETLLALDRKDAAVQARLASPEFRRELAAWEVHRADSRVRWSVLEPDRVASERGTTFTGLPDGSILAGGERPETDTYTVVARTRLRRVTAVRLELLADDALPHRGPGRQDNGNLHLSEFRLTAAARPVALRNPSADYDQPGWTVRHAIDGDPKTAWGIYPQVGRAHEAVFELAEPLTSNGDGSEMEFRLKQLHGRGHLIGRFRLSVTDAKLPVRASQLPATVAAALAEPADRRTATQWSELGAYVLRDTATRELAALPAETLVYAAASDFAPDGSHKPSPTPRPVHVLRRGDVRQPGSLAAPGVLACVPGRLDVPATAPEGERRAALAHWLTRPDNGLTWRSIANRIWHLHFGRGLVDTPNDFGKMGGKPSHPDLLDWLACEVREGGSLKALHRAIVTSATYRQSSLDPSAADADNRWLSRMNRSRLDAEQVRDAVLLAAGRLDRTAGGPSDRQFSLRPGLHVTPVIDYAGFDWGRPQGHRRSVYRFVYRTLPDPFVECLDGANASQLTPVRNASLTAPQALALLNDDFILVHARSLALLLERESPDRGRQVTLACERVWGRAPTAEESAEFVAYAGRHGLAALCRLLFNANEFLFVD